MGPPLPPRPMGKALGDASAPVTIEMFLDYVCPFSKRAFETMVRDVEPGLRGKIRVLFHQQVQPWHPQSTMTHEAALAVHKAGGDEAFWEFSKRLFAEQIKFFDLNVVGKSRDDVYAELVELANGIEGVDRDRVADMLKVKPDPSEPSARNTGNAVTVDLKWCTKFGRHRGVHVTPTMYINGIEDPSASSSWGLAEWTERITPLL